MLKARVLTAVLLVSVFVSAVFFLPPLGWVAFATVIASLAAWEWGALMKAGALSRVFLAVGMLSACFALALIDPAGVGLVDGSADGVWRLGRLFYWPAAFFWLVLAPLWLVRHWPLPAGALAVLVGMIVILPAWLALIQLRSIDSWLLVIIMAVVWCADTGAYVFGRALGRHKLAPKISPGKTWEGAIGGAGVVIAYGFIVTPQLPPFLSGNHLIFAVGLLFLTAVSVTGDLFESLLKRQVGLKDSSRILPGHGGILDRIDSLTSTLPLVALVLLSGSN